MNLKTFSRIIVVAVGLAVVAGCGGDRQLPSGPAPTGSIDDRIKAVQSNPNLSPQAKAMQVGQLQAQQKAGSAAPK